jgi:ferric-dicitrate binding protein FerR (iron transport regulator)
MAVLILNDGSQFRIAPNSSVRIEATAGKQTVQVVEGQVNSPATVESSLVRLELPAPSRRR